MTCLPAKSFSSRPALKKVTTAVLRNCLRCFICRAATTQPAAEVSYVERIRAMSALFKVGEMATSEVSQAALQAALNSVRDGSVFAANHYADALDIYV